MHTLIVSLLIFAALMFFAAAANIPSRGNFVAAGLCAFILTVLIPQLLVR